MDSNDTDPISVIRLGGSENEYVRALVKDKNADLIFAGYSNSADLQVAHEHISLDHDARKNKYNAVIGKYLIAEKRLITAAIGGKGHYKAFAVSTDSNDRIYVAGTISSYDVNQAEESDIFIAILILIERL
jgi:hypothetical protein